MKLTTEKIYIKNFKTLTPPREIEAVLFWAGRKYTRVPLRLIFINYFELRNSAECVILRRLNCRPEESDSTNCRPEDTSPKDLRDPSLVAQGDGGGVAKEKLKMKNEK